MIEIPPVVRKHLEQRNFWQFVTINSDGSPTATPLWVDVEGQYVIVNTGTGRLKDQNVRRDPRVCLAMINRDDPYSWVEIRGRVVELVEGPAAEESFDRFVRKYLGSDDDLKTRHPRAPTEKRVMLRIEPTTINYRTEPGKRPADLDFNP